MTTATKPEHGPSVGEYKDRSIPSWVRMGDGKTGDFVRIAAVDQDGGVDLDQLADDEFVIAPGLIYKERPEHDDRSSNQTRRTRTQSGRARKARR